MPAAAVIPAPIAYIKVVAVKKLVVGFFWRERGPPFIRCAPLSRRQLLWFKRAGIRLSACGCHSFTVRKAEGSN